MGLRSTIQAWLTPQERASWSPPLPYVDNYWPYLNFTGGPYALGGLTQTLNGNREEIGGDYLGLAGAYQSNAVLFTLLNVRASLFSQARFMYRQLRSGRPGELFSNPSLDILRNPWPGGTTSDLLAQLIQYHDLAGNAFAVRLPGRIAVPRPDWMTIVLGSQDEPDVNAGDLGAEVIGYLYHPGGPSAGRRPVVLLPDVVAHFAATPDPLATYRGISWVGSLLREVSADTAMTEHKRAFLSNGATPNLIVSLDPAVQKQAFDDWVRSFESKHVGVRNAYKTLYLGAGAKAQVVGADLAQLDFKLVQGAGESRMAAAAGVPPVVAGFSEGLQGSSLNAGNYASSMRRFADLTVRVLWQNVCGSLERIVPPPNAAELWYSDADIPALKDDIKDAADVLALNAQAIRSLGDGGWEPQSVIDAITSGDLKRLKHSGKLSVQLQEPGTKPEPEPEPEEEEEEEESPARAIAAALTALAAREQPAPVVNVHPADVTVNTPDVNLTIERGAFESPVTVTTPDVKVINAESVEMDSGEFARAVGTEIAEMLDRPVIREVERDEQGRPIRVVERRAEADA